MKNFLMILFFSSSFLCAMESNKIIAPSSPVSFGSREPVVKSLQKTLNGDECKYELIFKLSGVKVILQEIKKHSPLEWLQKELEAYEDTVVFLYTHPNQQILNQLKVSITEENDTVSISMHNRSDSLTDDSCKVMATLAIPFCVNFKNDKRHIICEDGAKFFTIPKQ